ncbi:hypothetical protein [Pseudomonas japonica]|uniref:Trypsin-like peptidase domain-containing protein n=1 Tax=Pseudomonas japonica TaxID=256466 RepID=A0A239D1S1_9PSED|nr:hypothetical protein [Pseudomonas japonica]SNS26476.1 hypothetical protein SAMN05444352_105189 [Pseudomonas japonica]
MKVDIDLKDPKVQFAFALMGRQVEMALDLPQQVESAVLPIYHTLKGNKPEQTGSGVAFQIGGEYFVMSASHVFDDIGTHALCMAVTKGELLCQFSGDRFSTPRGKSGTHSDDPVDASVFHIQSEVPDEFKRIALTLDDVDLEESDNLGCIYMAAGFRSKKSNTSGNQANAKRECIPSRELKEDDYLKLGLDRNIHLALAYENQTVIDGRWQTTPTPQGMSGGALIKAKGIPMVPKPGLPFYEENRRQLLSGITIAQRRERRGKPGVLIATRIKMHLQLIQNYLPEVFTASGVDA